MPRGKTQRSYELISACYDILKEIHPATVRAVCYQLFIRKLIPSMAKTCTVASLPNSSMRVSMLLFLGTGLSTRRGQLNASGPGQILTFLSLS
jgi:hypothetical protein